MNEESIFLEYVGDSPRMRLMQYFIEGREFDFMLTDMLNAGVSWGTLNVLVPKLADLGIIVKTRKIGRASLYKINKENLFSKSLIELYDNLVMESLEKVEEKKKVVVGRT